jgi:outer membrane protein assembly factor BamB
MAAVSAQGCGTRTETAAPPSPRPHAHGKHIRVVVLDGDLRRRVGNASVRIGAHRARTNGRGVARFRLGARAVVVTVTAKNYERRTVRTSFRRVDVVTVRVYQPRLQWTMYGADPARTGAQRALRLRPPFRIVWSIAHGDLVEFPAVVADGFAYVANGRGTIRAFSMRRGTVAWRRDTHTIMASSLAVWHDKLIAHGMGDGRIRVLDRKNGRVLWSKRIGSAIESSPVVRDATDYFGARNGRVYALNLRTRRLLWARSTGAKITASVALAGRTAYVGNYGGRVFALDSRTGRVRWTNAVNGRVYGTSPVAGGRVYVPSSTGGSVTAFSARGSRLWSFRTGSYVYSSPVIWAGRVVFGSYNGVLYCVAARTGALLWTARVGGAVSGAPVIVDGIAYAGSFGDRMIGVDVRRGRVIFRFPHGHYVPVSGNGGRLLLHGYSRIWAVEPRRR